MVGPPFESRTAMKEFILESIDDIISILKTLDHPERFNILTQLLTGSKSFQELTTYTRLQKSALGNHLSLLNDKNLIEKVDRGLYRLTMDGESILEQLAHSYLEIKIREHEKLTQVQKLIEKYTKQGVEPMNENEMKKIISELDVRIIKLEPMKIASTRAISKSPEEIAWKKMKDWAQTQGLLQNTQEHPVFGFNNPDPSPDKEEYGYEFWIKIDDEITPEKGIDIKEFSGGLYAVTTTRLMADPNEPEFPALKKLFNWVKSNKEYEFGEHQLLEKHINPLAPPSDLVLDLYCPIKKK